MYDTTLKMMPYVTTEYVLIKIRGLISYNLLNVYIKAIASPATAFKHALASAGHSTPSPNFVSSENS